MSLDNFFNAKRIALVGVSRDPAKVGHVIFRNLIDGAYKGKLFLVNPKAKDIMHHKVYPSLLKIKEKIDLAVIAVPAKYVLKVIEECGKKKIHDVVIITAGFKEIGNHELDKKLEDLLKKHKIRAIGPNCLGVLNIKNGLDTLFMPKYRVRRPKKGYISFVSQSGAIGSSILDLASREGYGFAKFASYGNAMNLDETDLIEYLGNDEDTKVICLYIEAIKDGKKFMKVAREVVKKKPLIAIKGGLTEAGNKATLSHTGSLAGNAEVYLSALKQLNIIRAESLEEMFNFARLLAKTMPPKGGRVQIITNGGGYGILATDAVVHNKLKMAELSKKSKEILKNKFPPIVAVANPMDLVGDATTERYTDAINVCLGDDNIDILLIILLFQTPLITPDVVDVITEFNDLHEKPIIFVATGGEFTELLKKNLEENNVPTFSFPEEAVRAIKVFVDYYTNR